MAKDGCPYDFIVVGVGTAGSVLAARLSEDADRRVPPNDTMAAVYGIAERGAESVRAANEVKL